MYRPEIKILLIVLSVFFLESNSWSCGGEWPDPLLADTDNSLKIRPEAIFDEEAERIRTEFATGELQPVKPYEFDESRLGGEETAKWDIEQVSQSLWHIEPALPNRQELLSQYETIRKKLCDYLKAKAAEQDPRTIPVESRKRELLGAQIPEAIPREFAEYLRGAIAYHIGDATQARVHWKAVLDLPEEQRKTRTLWATYMLGRSLVREDPAQAIEWFQKVHKSRAALGDCLDFETKSTGWEACAELQRGNYTRAIEIYMSQYQKGIDTRLSLRFTARKLVRCGNPETLEKAAEDPLTQELVTAYLISERYSDDSSLGPQPAIQWLNTLEKTAPQKIRNMDRLALAAYRTGNMTDCGRWLELADPASQLTQWLQAKMLLRAGKFDQAQNLLARLAPAHRTEAFWGNIGIGYWRYNFDLPPADHLWGELGITYVEQGRFIEALDAMLRGNQWEDAAYLAERVLSLDELRVYVDKEWPEARDPLSSKIRYLLGRRMVRQGVLFRTDDYLPEKLRYALKDYAAALETARDASRGTGVRAKAYLTAARIARHQGLELMGTELEPDWFIYHGQVEQEPISKIRVGLASMETLSGWDELEQVRDTGIDATTLLTPSRREEESRVRASAPYPNLRFHYRYIAASLAWEAAQLMPDNTDETAQVLYEAGCWIKVRAPHFADRFYKALVRRCPNTALGRAADIKRWFPDSDKVEASPPEN